VRRGESETSEERDVRREEEIFVVNPKQLNTKKTRDGRKSIN